MWLSRYNYIILIPTKSDILHILSYKRWESKKREEVSRKMTATVTTTEREGPLAELTTLVPKKMTTTMMSSWKCLLMPLSIFFTSVDIIFLFFFCCSLQGHLHQSTSVPCVGHSQHMSDSIFGSVISFFFLRKMGSNAHVP